jgi:hypothetical protein
MRTVLLAIVLTSLAGQEGDDRLARRHGFDVNENRYSQKTPEEALKSVILAIDSKKIDYLVAHLADPNFVDTRVKEYAKSQTGDDDARTFRAFARLVQETTDHFLEDPLLIKELKLFAKEGEWKADDASATASVKTLPDRRVFMRKVQNRWFLENRQK